MNSRGFVMIGLTTLLPILLVFVIFCAGLSIARLETSRKLHLCRTQVLEAQKHYANSVQELTKLNPLARRLRLLRQKAESALKIAISTANPFAIEAAQTWLLAVKMRQKALRTQQFLIITQTQSQVYQILWKFRRDLQKQRNQQPDETHVYISPTFLHMKAIPQFSDSPDYMPEENFELKQEIIVRITTNPNTWYANYGGNWLNFKRTKSDSDLHSLRVEKNNKSIFLMCSATLNKEENLQWLPKLKKAKF